MDMLFLGGWQLKIMDISQFFVKSADLEGLNAQETLPCAAMPTLSGGLPLGKLIEMQGAQGSGKTETLLRFFQENSSLQVAWIEVGATIYPCAFSERGVDLSRVLFVEAKDASEALWSAHQIIKSQIFGAVVLSQLDCLAQETQVTPHPTQQTRPRDPRSTELRGPRSQREISGSINEIELRRLQIAAEKSKAMIFFLNEKAISQDSWPLEVQMKFYRNAVQEVQIEILKARRGQWKQAVRRNIG
jgi:RecA/RadA recombinase